LQSASTGAKVAQHREPQLEDEMRARRLVVLIVLVAIGATACGSSSKGAANDSTSTTAASAPSGSTDGSTDATTTTEKLSGDSGSSFCDLMRKDDKAFNGSGLGTATPAALKKLYENIGPAIDEAKSKAPDSLKDDFGTFSTALSKFVGALSDANYDFKKLSVADLGSLSSPAMTAASAHIDQYLSQVCHIASSGT
jgi:ABC-type phosphate transport system substrate-binding protein